MKTLPLLISLCALASSPTLATAQTQIHVSPTGNDVTGDGSSGNPYKTISFAATQATSGDTLVLAAGTFGDDEQIVLGTKDLTILGQGPGLTVVRPHPTLNYSLPRGFPSSPTYEDHRCVFVVEGAARVDIRDLTVDGAFRMPSNGRLIGVYYRDGADGTIENVEIVNVRADPLTGAQGPVAAYVRGDGTSDTCEVTFRSCLVHEWGKGGIGAFFDAVLTVEHSTITGSGRLDVGLPAQNCLQITYDAVGIIRFNKVTDSSYIPTTWGASGILMYDCGAGTVVEGNEFARCEGSIWLYNSTASNVPTYIRGNESTACYGGGLWIQGQTGVVAEGNVLAMPDSTEIPVYDDTTGGNTWLGNYYSDYSGTGPYAIDGGSSVDPAPLAGCRAFGSSVSVALGAVPVQVLALDLDGANGNDFVTVNEGSTPSLSVGLDNGSGYTVTNVPFGASACLPVAIASGDFDGAGGTDIAVLATNVPPATTENKVFVFSNTAGVLSLLHTESLPAGVYVPNDLAAGDLDGGTGDDLVVADLGTVGVPGSVVVLLNAGTGTGWTTSTLGGFTSQCQGIAVGDVDGDSILDLAVAEGDGTTGFAHVLAGDGVGGFTPIAASPFAVAVNPNAIAIADLDVDGANDLLVSSYGAAVPLDSGFVTTLRNELPAGMPALATPVDRGPTSVAAGDLGDDADPDSVWRDAVVANFVAGTTTVLGSYTADAGFGSGTVCHAGVTPRSAVIAEMTGDAFADLVVADAGGQAVVILPGRATARVDLYGAGCAGTSDRIPSISTIGSPAIAWQPNLSFGVEMRDALPFAVSVLNASFAPGAALGPCDLLLASIDVSWVRFTTAAGTAAVAIPVPPPTPDLIGVSLYFQWAVIDPEGDLLDQIALSQGLKVRIGH